MDRRSEIITVDTVFARLFAFEQAFDDSGQAQPDWTTFHVPDIYPAHAVAVAPPRFAWVASVHPYRLDALVRLEAAIALGAVAVQWLPSAMNIDLRDPRCRPFCERLARHLVAHGTKVIAAHCASLGRADHTDQPSAPLRPAFELFARLMDEPEWPARLPAAQFEAQALATPAAPRRGLS